MARSAASLSASDRLVISVARGDDATSQRVLAEHSVDFAELVETTHRHKIAPLVFSRLASLELPEAIRDDVLAARAQLVQTAGAINVHARRELRSVVELLRDAQIESMLIKGPAVDPNPLRQMNEAISRSRVEQPVSVQITARPTLHRDPHESLRARPDTLGAAR